MPEPPFLRLGLIGWPVEHSLSPALHLAGLEALGLDGEYRLYPVRPLPKGMDELAKLIQEMRAGRLHGLNVTIPHKRSMLAHLDELTPLAQAAGAVNTIIRRGSKLTGDNTDVPGFISSLEQFLGNKPVGSRRALVLGAGGAARGVVYGLVEAGWSVVIAARRIEQARSLAGDLDAGNRLEAILLEAASLRREIECRTPDLIVNATPVGMHPNVEGSPWPNGVPFPQDSALYDLIYNPRSTRLVQTARSAGLTAVGGAGMLVEQAALALERWTGREVPRRPLYRAIEASLPEPQEAR